MQLKEFAEILRRHAEEYCVSDNFKALLEENEGAAISTELVEHLLEPLLFLCRPDYPDDIRQALPIRLSKWAPSALASIHRNSHMNLSKGVNVLTQDTADALIVDFINYSSIPMDYGMYAKDLR